MNLPPREPPSKVSRRHAFFVSSIALALRSVRQTAWAGERSWASLIGQPAKEWRVENWIHSTPLTLKQLRGKVVLVRWWTAPSCPYCAATAAALNEFHEAYRKRGLMVIGFYHHKSPTPLDADEVKFSAEKFGFKFPVAIDPKWQTLKQWWLNGAERDFTSVSFLIGRDGRIRHIHPGGEYVKGDADYSLMKRKIEEALAEPAPKA